MIVRQAKRQSGQVLITLALSMMMLVGSVGLAVDSGMGYLVKAKLNAAVDAAGIAAARAASQGTTQDTQAASAKAAAYNFFDANYPSGYLGTTAALNEPSIAFDKGKITINLSASATLPFTIMPALGFKQVSVAASAQSVRKDLDLAFVMDISSSLYSVRTQVKSSAKLFIEKFNPTSDRMALVHFANGGVKDVQFDTANPDKRGFNRTTIESKIDGFTIPNTSSSTINYTNSAEGMWNGLDELMRFTATKRSNMRVIVFFSDGAPNTFASQFKFKSGKECTKIGSILASNNGIDGLWDPAKDNTALTGNCHPSSLSANLATDAIPVNYNAHGSAAFDTYPLLSGQKPTPPKTIGSSPSYTNVLRIARMLPEAMAWRAREDQGVYIFTLGLGSELKTSVDGQTGEEMLKCMANSVDAPARCRSVSQPTGLYCYAASESELTPCFSRLASEILRLTM